MTTNLIDEIINKPRVISLKKTCAACPSQWDGLTDDNRKVYYRYRWGWLTVTTGAIGDMSEYAAVRGNKVFSAELADSLHGILSTEDMLTITKGKVIHDLPQSDLEAIAKYEADDEELQKENNAWFAEQIAKMEKAQ